MTFAKLDSCLLVLQEEPSSDEWSYNIQPWAWEYLHKHPELVTISDEETTQEYLFYMQFFIKY
jgi:hypothetical protein